MSTKEKIQSESTNKVKLPPLYKVIFHNDDFTPFDFVTEILKVIFHKKQKESEILAQEIHKKGMAVVGVYSKEIAISKQDTVTYNAKNHNYPLMCTIEKE